MNGLVSIVTTLYNYSRYIGDLAESVVNQTYEDWEWIIVDDASTDNPMSVLAKYTENDRIRVIHHDKNYGYSKAKNTGIKASKGDYIVMIDADDMLTEKSVEIRKALLDENPDKIWCHGEALIADERIEYKKGVSTKKKFGEGSRNWKRRFRKELTDDGWDLTKTYHHRLIHAQTVMVRPELHKIYGLYDEKLRFSSDNEMWRRIIIFGEIPAHTEEFVCIYRVHPKRMCQSEFKRKNKNKVKGQIVRDVEKRFREGINKENTILWD